MDNKRLGIVAGVGNSSKSFRGNLGGLQRQPSFHLQRHIHELVEEYKRDPNIDLNEKVAKAVDADFPTIHHYPTPPEMDESIMHAPSNKHIKFDKGQWCEFLGYDMKWHLAHVERVVRVAPDNWEPSSIKDPDWEYCYQFEGGTLCRKNEVRATEEGLKRIFGVRPWVWQQWAMLKTEDFARFQHLHERDFELMNFTMSASFLFKSWLNHASNKDFKDLFESRTVEERQKLLYHLSTPFILMDEIAKKDGIGGDWDLKESNISVYMYQSILGAGWVTSILVLGLQLIIPAMLLYAAMVRSPRIDTVNGSDFQLFCSHGGPVDGLIVNACVIIFYGIRQMPMVMYTFFETAGEADTTRSRLNSLRLKVFEQGRDTLGMQVGFKLEKYMNSTYIALVNNLMLFVLFLQNDPSEIILNAISIEFVVYFGREVANAIWLDPNTRYIRAGGVELVFRSVLTLSSLANARSFCKKYDIAYEDYVAAIGEDGFNVNSGLRVKALARRDEKDPQFFTAKNAIWKVAEQYARKSGNRVALWVFGETEHRFDAVCRWLSLFGLGGSSIFNRYHEYHTWSRWDKVLFLSPCTRVARTTTTGDTDVAAATAFETVDLYASSLLVSVQEEMSNEDRVRYNNYLNDSYEVDYDVVTRFMLDIYKTLTFQYYVISLRNAIHQRSIVGFVFRLVDGIFEWFAYFYQVIFPLTLIGYMILLLSCY